MMKVKWMYKIYLFKIEIIMPFIVEACTMYQDLGPIYSPLRHYHSVSKRLCPFVKNEVERHIMKIKK